MKRIFYIIFVLLFLITAPASVMCAESPKAHIDLGNKYLIDDRPFAAVEEFKLAIDHGANDPVLFRNLSIILYDLGFLDEAENYMKKALALSPYANSFQMELGIIYLAKNDYQEARKQFMEVLDRNPGFANAYYYIGEVCYRTNDYDMAWMFAETAKELNHKSNSLIEKLKRVSEAPDIRIWEQAGESLLIRQILVDTRSRADEIVKRIHDGELFEDVANEIDKTLNSVGGFLGNFEKSELHPKISKALIHQKVFSEPVIVETELGFHIVQRILPFDFERWKQLLAEYRKSDTARVISAKAAPQRNTVELPVPLVESKISRNVTLVSSKQPAPPAQAVGEKPELVDGGAEKKYLVFAGAFSQEKNAIERNEKLRSLGLPSYIHHQKARNGLIHTVIAGKFDTLQKAREAGKNIASHGVDYFISR